MNKRGVYFFIVDVVIGVLIFLTTVLVISSFFIPRPSLGGIDQNLDILTEDYFTFPVTDLPDNLTESLPPNFIKDDVTVDELVYLLNVTGGYSSENIEIVKWVCDWLPDNFGFRYKIDIGQVVIYERDTSLGVNKESAEVVVSRQKVTGIDSEYGLQYPALTEVTIWR